MRSASRQVMANVHQVAMVSKVVEVTRRCANRVPFSSISQSKPSSPTHCIGRMIMTMCAYTMAASTAAMAGAQVALNALNWLLVSPENKGQLALLGVW